MGYTKLDINHPPPAFGGWRISTFIMINTDPKRIDEILERGTIVEILPTKKEFRDKLLSGEKLRFYCGFDATAPTLHLGHARNFLLLEKFRQLGHEVIVLFGDFTARIGDPDKEAVRKQLSKKEVDFNVSQWEKLIEPLIDLKDSDNPALIKYNSEWLSKLTFEEIINLSSNFTVQQMIERDMFQKRIKEKRPVYLHEFFYPLMQGYDSVAMDVDVELCSTDQIFNALAGRTLLKKLKNKDKFVVAGSMLGDPKTDEVMSKSKGAGVFLDASSNDIYGQVMAQPDSIIEVLFINLTELSLSEIKDLDIANKPMEAKKKLAYEITKLLHGEKKASEAQESWISQFSEKEIPTDLPLIDLAQEEGILFKILSKIAPEIVKSNSLAKTLIEQKSVDINSEVIIDPYFVLEKNKEYIIKIGKKIFKRIILR